MIINKRNISWSFVTQILHNSSTCHDGDRKTIELTCTNSFNELNVKKKSNTHHRFMFGVVIRKETNKKENYAAELKKKTKMYEKTYHDLISKGRVILLEPYTTEIQK